jgi:hypothetical protein
MEAKMEATTPSVIRRACGGWLAIAQQGAPFSIAVTGHTEAEAVEAFRRAELDWWKIITPGMQKNEPSQAA